MSTHIYRDNKLVKVSNYDTNLMLCLTNIFPNDKYLAASYLQKKKDVTGKLRDIYNTKDNSSLVRKILRVFLKTLILDMVQGNCAFNFPGHSKAEMYVGYIDDTNLKKVRQRGSLKDFDLLATNYKVPCIKYKFSKKSHRQELQVYLNKKLYKEFIDTANSSKIFSKYPKNIKHFLPQIYEQFPYIKENSIERLLKFCLGRIVYNLRHGEELRILDEDGEIRFFRPLGAIHDKVMNKVKKQRITRELNRCKIDPKIPLLN